MERSATEPVDNTADAFFGVIHDVAHVGADRGPAELRNDTMEFLHAFFVRRDLRLDVGNIHVGATGRVTRAGQQCPKIGLAERSAIDQQEIVDDDALFLQRARLWRGGAGGDPPDIGMMSATANEEQYFPLGIVEDRRDHRYVGQMCAAVERVIQCHNIAGFKRISPVVQHRAHAFAHGAEMHRNMGRVGHQPALGVEDGAGEIEAFLDVHAHGRVLQHRARLFRDVHEQVVEQLEQHRVRPVAARRHAGGQRLRAAQQHVVQSGDLGGPAGFDQGGGVRLAD